MIILTNDERQPTFDSYAQDYSNIVAQSLSTALKGNPHEYFEQYKIFCLKDILTEQKRDVSSPLKLLDYGCGRGVFSQALLHAMPGTIIHGFDPSTESVSNTPAELHIGSNLFTSNLDDLHDDYDAALLVTVMHHVLPVSERPAVIHNIYSRLRPGGKIIIIEHNMINPLTRKAVDSCEFDEEAIMLRPSECQALLRGEGFSDISSRYIVFFPKQLERLRFIEKYIHWLPLGAQFITFATKS